MDYRGQKSDVRGRIEGIGKPKKENKMLLLVGIISFLVLVFSIVVSADNGHKEIKTPILDQSTVPGYCLGSSKFDKSLDTFETAKVRYLWESWATLPREEIIRLRRQRSEERKELRKRGIKNVNKHLKKSPIDKLKVVSFTITIFESSKKAEKYAPQCMRALYAGAHFPATEGSFSGKPIGDKCWTLNKKDSKLKSQTIYFIKNNVYVKLTLSNPDVVDKSFAEKVARYIASKF